MKQMFTKKLFLYMLVAFIVTISGVFVLQTVIIQKSNVSASESKLADVKEKLEANKENVATLTENLSADNLAKARAFADILAENRSIAEDKKKLEEIKVRLQVNELHIIDEKGIITSSTIDDYVGFDMKSGEQSNAFMVIVDDPAIEGCERFGTGRRPPGGAGEDACQYAGGCCAESRRFRRERICLCH